MSARDTLSAVAEAIASALQPLVAALDNTDALRDFLEELGWDLNEAPTSLNALKLPIESVDALLSGGSDGNEIDDAALLDALLTAFDAIRALSSAGDLPDPFRSEFPEQLVDHLLVGYLTDDAPAWGAVLSAIGIIQVEDVPASGDRLAYERRTLAREKVVQFVNDPLQAVKDTYRWGQSDFAGEFLLERVADLARALGFPLGDHFPSSQVLDQLNAAALNDDDKYTAALKVVLFGRELGEAAMDLGIGVFVLPETSAAKPGLALLSSATGALRDELDLSDDLVVDLEGDLTGELGVLVRPGQPPGTIAGAAFGVSFTFAPSSKTTLVGSDAGTRLETAGAGGGLTVAVVDGEVELVASLDAVGLQLVIASGDPDGFVGAALPSSGTSIPIPFGLEWSTRTGLRFKGGGGFSATIPLDVNLGLARVESVSIATRGDAATNVRAAVLEVAATIAGSIGPVQYEIAGTGLRLTTTFDRGNLGPIDLQVGFKPPNGAGLRIDAGIVSGGGFASFDEARGEYSGALELEVAGLALDALAVIDTRLPSQQRGFSMVAVVSAQFPQIQLGLGFTLDGVGGLIGIHRRADTDALRAAIRTTGIDDIFFPSDPVAHAARLLGDLAAYFPATHGRHIFGPAAKIGWGTPEVVTAKVALLLEVPAPVRIVLLGDVQLGLPTLDKRIVDIRLDVLGVLDFDRRTLAIDASLHDSKLAGYALTGDMALRIGWGDDAQFLFSIGGFHPHFAPPPGFPTLRRLALTAGDNPQLRLDAYLALTSNTAQVGAHADLTFTASSLEVKGHLGFDALFEFSPFHFEVEIAASASIAWHGHNLAAIDLDFLLDGPHPWHAKGHATFSILWCDVSVGFDATWGDAAPEPLPPAPDIAKALHDALVAPEAWSGALPDGVPPWIVVADSAKGGDRVHPFAVVTVQQRVAPLDYDITQFGNIPLAAPHRFRISTLSVAGMALAVAPVQDVFAPGQFTRLSADERLTAPSFERFDAGARIGAGAAAVGATARATMDTDTIVDDRLAPPAHPPPRVAIPIAIASAAALRASGAQPPPPRTGPRVRDLGFALVSVDDLSITAESAAITRGRRTFAALREALDLRGAEAGRRPPLQVVSHVEVANRNVRVVVVREDEHLRNADFVDAATGRPMTRADFVDAIHKGDYPEYEVRVVHGVPTPVSRPNATTADNLG